MDRHLSAIHALGWYMLGDRGLAEDVAQETFLRFWQAAPRWDADGTATIQSWLRRVATRLCIDERRRKGPIYSDQLPDVADPDGGAVAQMMAGAQSTRIAKALADLPARQRVAITLSYFQHLSQNEGAAALDISAKAYESLLSRAKSTLRAALLPEKESLLS
jgi:RNA polymerase sigma-70 factor (ECF subfamily)